MIWTAFAIGLFGSLHCMGMCGPIILALPEARGGRISGIVLYQFGRIFTYSLTGLVFGSLGKIVSLGGLQQWLSIAAGIFILIMIIPSLGGKKLLHIKGFAVMQTLVSKGISAAMKQPSAGTLLIAGSVNGLLPCGLVYLALAGAAATGTPLEGAAYMGLFGLGTVPMLSGIIVGKKLMPLRIREKLRPVMPVFFIVLGLLILARGLNLGIPYVSPKINKEQVQNCH